MLASAAKGVRRVVGQGTQELLDAAKRGDHLELELLVPGQVCEHHRRLVLHVRRTRAVVHRMPLLDAARGYQVRRWRAPAYCAPALRAAPATSTRPPARSPRPLRRIAARVELTNASCAAAEACA